MFTEYYCDYINNRGSLCQEGPYHSDSTTSSLLSEVKHCRARLVLRWGTTLESLVLFFCFFCQASCGYLVPCPHGASKICKKPAMLEFLVLFFCFFLSSKLRLSGPGIYIKFPEYYCGYRSNRGSLCQERPYHSDSTASRLLSEVKHCRARLVLRWGTTLESLVLFFCFFVRLVAAIWYHTHTGLLRLQKNPAAIYL